MDRIKKLVFLALVLMMLKVSVSWFSFDKENDYFAPLFIMLFDVELISLLFNIKGLKSFDNQKYVRTFNLLKLVYALLALHYFIYSNVENSFWPLGMSVVIWLALLILLTIFIAEIVNTNNVEDNQKIKNAIIWYFNEDSQGKKLDGVYIEKGAEEKLIKIISVLKQKLKITDNYKIDDTHIEILSIGENNILVNVYLKSSYEFVITEYVVPLGVRFNTQGDISSIRLLYNVRKK